MIKNTNSIEFVSLFYPKESTISADNHWDKFWLFFVRFGLQRFTKLSVSIPRWSSYDRSIWTGCSM